MKLLKEQNIHKKVIVVGAGYIGVELVEAFRDNGKRSCASRCGRKSFE